MFYYVDGDWLAMKKITAMTIVFFLGGTIALSQDLVTVAKKEKQRRAQLVKKNTVVVTNVDLDTINREPIISITLPEEQAQNIQKTPPSKPAVPIKRQPAQQIENIDQIDLKVDQLDQLEARGFRSDYAIQVRNSNAFVRNPELALDKPDGRFAELSIYGVVDIEINAVNGPGDDIVIYAKQAGAKELMAGGEEEGGLSELAAFFQYWEGLWYGVLGREKQGDWVAIGKGTGTKGQERFDLGSLSSVNRIRIMFKPHSNGDRPVQFVRSLPNESFFGIDAVESLHK